MTELADAIDKIKTQFDGVQSAMKTSQEQLAKAKAEHQQWSDKLAAIKQDHAAKISELEAKKVAADRSAEENARRIKLNNDQVAELDRIRKELDEREKKVAAREKAADLWNDAYKKNLAELARRDNDMSAKESEIRARYAKMKEAMA